MARPFLYIYKLLIHRCAVFSLRLGHGTALALSTQFTTVPPLRYLLPQEKANNIYKTRK